MTQYVVRSINFGGDGGVVVEYADMEKDVKSNGLVINHVAFCPAEEYEDEIDEVFDAVRHLIDSFTADSIRLGPPDGPRVPEPEDDD